eukprot:4765463-Pleurochrysis_carterae.AAC.1
MLLGTLSSVLYARWLLPALLSRGSQISSDMHLLVALRCVGRFGDVLRAFFRIRVGTSTFLRMCNRRI